MTPPIKVEIGTRYGLLTVVSEAPPIKGSRAFNLVCDCKRTCVVVLRDLRSQHTKSCGCLQITHVTKHGLARTPEYQVWADMKSRCLNIKHKCYSHYGGRGIRVCAAWIDSFEAFIECVGPRPTSSHTLDRIDNSKGYEPDNVRWVLAAVQSRNTRRTRMLTFNGQTLCIKDWALLVGLSPFGLKDRLSRGWSVERALTTPPIKLKTARAATGEFVASTTSGCSDTLG